VRNKKNKSTKAQEKKSKPLKTFNPKKTRGMPKEENIKGEDGKQGPR